jgi:DNA-binding NarL/FixJ family response regulator
LFPTLPEREREVLGLLVCTNTAAIARDLFPSPKTIANHAGNIVPKPNRREHPAAGTASRRPLAVVKGGSMAAAHPRLDPATIAVLAGDEQPVRSHDR